MLLSVYERLILLNILPREGNITTLKIVRKLREDLSFSEEEHKALQFNQEGPEIKWINEADTPKEIEVGEKATDIITSTLTQLNSQSKLHEEHLPIYERFIEGKG